MHNLPKLKTWTVGCKTVIQILLLHNYVIHNKELIFRFIVNSMALRLYCSKLTFTIGIALVLTFHTRLSSEQIAWYGFNISSLTIFVSCGTVIFVTWYLTVCHFWQPLSSNREPSWLSEYGKLPAWWMSFHWWSVNFDRIKRSNCNKSEGCTKDNWENDCYTADKSEWFDIKCALAQTIDCIKS